MILHDYRPSGNGYKVRLLLNLLQQPYEYREYNIIQGETHTPDFLNMNPAGKIPVLELNDGRFLSESNAILYFLAQGTEYWPTDIWEQAQVLKWMNFEQYSHEPNIATPRFWLKLLEMDEERRRQLPAKQAQGRQALTIMNEHLTQHTWFAAERYTIADIALYAYTHVADEGGFDLSNYPHILQWMDRLASQPNHSRINEP